jgi:hypothetical protein
MFAALESIAGVASLLVVRRWSGTPRLSERLSRAARGGILCVVSLNACTGTEPLSPESIVVTTAQRYRLVGEPSSTAVAYRLYNGSPDTILLARCLSQLAPTVEQQTGDAWELVQGAVCPASGGSGALRLAPRDSVKATITLAARGVFRLRFHGRSVGAERDESWVSNRFVVE